MNDSASESTESKASAGLDKGAKVGLAIIAAVCVGVAAYLVPGYRAVWIAKRMVSEKLKDPSSAEFTGIFHSKRHDDGKKTICGEVNGRNSYGGYVGFKRFIYVPENAKVFIEDSDADEFIFNWVNACTWPFGRPDSGAAPVPSVAPPASPPPSPEQKRVVCRAAIAMLYRQPYSIMRVTKETFGDIRIEYRRPSDGSKWINDCQIRYDQVVYRGVDAKTGQVGRWRDSERDEKIKFEVSNVGVSFTTIQTDGSSDVEFVKVLSQ